MRVRSLLPMRARAILAASALLVTGGAAFAQNPPSTPSAPPAPSSLAGTALTLTVEQTLARALANQPVIQQAQAAVEAARARVGQAQSGYYPFVSGTGSYTRISDQSFAIASTLPPGTLSALGVSPNSPLMGLLEAPISFAPLDNWDFNVGLNQVIYQFGKRGIQVKLAENGVDAARIGVEQIQLSLAYQTVQGFYAVIFLKGQLAALDTQRQNLQEHLDGVRARMETGSATRYDELSTEARVSVLDSQRIDAENQLNKQLIGLRQLAGIDESVPVDLQGEFRPAADFPPRKSSLIDSAMSNRPEVRQALEAESAAELNRRLTATGSWPTISGHASIAYKNGNLPDLAAMGLTWAAGIQLSVPIFEGFLLARQGEEADKKLLAARESTLAVKRTLTTQVLQAAQDVDASRRQVESARTQLEQAQGVVDVVKVQYDLGLLTNLEYLDAQAGLERAQLGMLLAQYREVLSEYALRQAIGERIWMGGTSRP